jgi:hypothetical protein
MVSHKISFCIGVEVLLLKSTRTFLIHPRAKRNGKLPTRVASYPYQIPRSTSREPAAFPGCRTDVPTSTTSSSNLAQFDWRAHCRFPFVRKGAPRAPATRSSVCRTREQQKVNLIPLRKRDGAQAQRASSSSSSANAPLAGLRQPGNARLLGR